MANVDPLFSVASCIIGTGRSEITTCWREVHPIRTAGREGTQDLSSWVWRPGHQSCLWKLLDAQPLKTDNCHATKTLLFLVRLSWWQSRVLPRNYIYYRRGVTSDDKVGIMAKIAIFSSTRQDIWPRFPLCCALGWYPLVLSRPWYTDAMPVQTICGKAVLPTSGDPVTHGLSRGRVVGYPPGPGKWARTRIHLPGAWVTQQIFGLRFIFF